MIKNYTQEIIKQFKVQSFAIKGFSLTFLGLLIQPYYDNPNIIIGMVYIAAIFIFWYLDAFYLRMERIYRDIEKKTEKSEIAEEFSLDYQLHQDSKNKHPMCSVMLSKTILPLYAIQLILVIVIYLFN